MKTTFLLLFCFFISSCSQDPEATSMYQIIADPDRFDGKTVMISGYYVHEFEDTAIYVTPYAHENYVPIDGFWVEFSPEYASQLYTNDGVEHPEALEAFSRRHVLIVGEFTKSKKGHMGAYTGSIIDATRIIFRERI